MNLTTGLGWEMLIFILQTALILGLGSESCARQIPSILNVMPRKPLTRIYSRSTSSRAMIRWRFAPGSLIFMQCLWLAGFSYQLLSWATFRPCGVEPSWADRPIAQMISYEAKVLNLVFLAFKWCSFGWDGWHPRFSWLVYFDDTSGQRRKHSWGCTDSQMTFYQFRTSQLLKHCIGRGTSAASVLWN